MGYVQEVTSELWNLLDRRLVRIQPAFDTDSVAHFIYAPNSSAHALIGYRNHRFGNHNESSPWNQEWRR